MVKRIQGLVVQVPVYGNSEPQDKQKFDYNPNHLEKTIGYSLGCIGCRHNFICLFSKSVAAVLDGVFGFLPILGACCPDLPHLQNGFLVL